MAAAQHAVRVVPAQLARAVYREAVRRREEREVDERDSRPDRDPGRCGPDEPERDDSGDYRWARSVAPFPAPGLFVVLHARYVVCGLERSTSRGISLTHCATRTRVLACAHAPFGTDTDGCSIYVTTNDGHPARCPNPPRWTGRAHDAGTMARQPAAAPPVVTVRRASRRGRRRAADPACCRGVP